ncbi:1-acyl-sn-glycerol-3-phosphate acyltransferase, partial [Candidatus Aerophobetes bacterium]|nr:1-acyl-sn-glycerol-3-phosphate acyltransferase [Candidatus Aerophobetes bacterium]
LFGKIITSLGAFPLKREKINKSAYKKAIQILKGGRILALFPEGTRSISGKLGNLKEGFIRIAIQCQVPVIPVVIRGTEKALPPGKKFVKLEKIRVKIGEPVKIYFEGKEKDKIVQNLLEELRKEMITMGANR